jgi:hypothetical protein
MFVPDPDPGLGSGFFYLSWIPDPGFKKTPDPGAGSATLVDGYSFFAEAGSYFKSEGFGP